MNLNILTEIEQRFRHNADSIWKANHLLSVADFLLNNPNMEYWAENAENFKKHYKEYLEYHAKPKSLILESKDMVAIGKG